MPPYMMQPMHMQQLQPYMPYSELIYTLIVVFLCFFIYFKTKESYKLTGHIGIKYFRQIFLFLGISYIVRFLLHLLTLSSITFDFFIPRGFLFLITLVLVGYFGTLAIASMAYSVVWKKIKEKYFVIFSHVFAFLVIMLMIFFGSLEILVLVQFLLFIAAIVLSGVFHKKTKQFKNTLIIYSLIFVFWFMNIFVIIPGRIFPFEIKSVIQLLSLGVFIIIFYKTTKWLK